ncbi:MAG: riboflavin kinase [bacterium]
MKFQTTTISGAGRGKTMGYPTVNMIVPDDIPVVLRPGVYAAKAIIKNQMYNGALYYGPIPVFNQTDSSLEIYLLDTLNLYVPEGELIEIETVKFIRGVMEFDFPELLIRQMDTDVALIRKALKI